VTTGQRPTSRRTVVRGRRADFFGDVISFAEDIGVAPWIVVGRMQFDEYIAQKQLTELSTGTGSQKSR
jgi:hypothetical protein